MAGIVSRLPFPFSGRTSAASASYALDGVQYAYAIGGMPWLSAISDDRAMTRAGAQMRKDQLDNAKEPGEQSLSNWWLRSQATFIGGEGLLYQDPDPVAQSNLQNRHAIQYGHSVGLNPWVNGKLTLLRRTTQRIADASANRHFLIGYNDGTDRYWSAVGSVLKSDDGTTATTVTWGGANTIRALASDGTAYYAADNVSVYKGVGTGVGAVWTATGTTNVCMGWAKGRIMIGLDNKIYECDTAGTKTLRFTHLNSAWTWTAIAEGTNAIYAAGYAGSQGAIYKFVLDSTGAVPTLASGGIQTAQLPLGEVVYSLTTYLGTFVGLGTSRGFRVGEIDGNGDIAYGPLLISNASGVKCVAAYDRFFFAAATNGIDGKSGLYRVDLGQPVQDSSSAAGGRFAYATDLQAGVTGEVCAATNFGNSDRMVFAVVGQGAYLEHATDKEATGYLTTGRVRYSTLEPKIFKFVSVKTPNILMGSVGVSVIDPGGAETSILTVSQGAGATITDVSLASPTTAVEWIQLKLTIGRSSTDTTQGGEVNGWQLKAMPGSTRQRVFTIPLLCFDREKTISGQMVGTEGRSLARLQAFEQIFARGDAVTFQDLRSDQSYLVVIDDYRYEQRAQPGTNSSNYGGILWVELRTINDVVTA
ncbi:hypothetical protein AB0E62_00340 [Streptomyces sp. NPDC038707]|uniref:hypothetical protein n=1 Tax=Streptomyces sp. NPDC038707 TaxID=3154329 RepID=UPI0033C15EEF